MLRSVNPDLDNEGWKHESSIMEDQTTPFRTPRHNSVPSAVDTAAEDRVPATAAPTTDVVDLAYSSDDEHKEDQQQHGSKLERQRL